MRIDRRTFIQSAILTTLPALAALLPLSSAAETPPVTAAGKDGDHVVFKIEGWDHCGAKISTEHEVLIRINQSWRPAWR
jgi:hypothetical protein